MHSLRWATRVLSITAALGLVAFVSACGTGSKKKGSICSAAECSSGVCFNGQECVTLGCQGSLDCSGDQTCVTFGTGEERCVANDQLTSVGSEDTSESRDTASEDGLQPDLALADLSTDAIDTSPVTLTATCGKLDSALFVEGELSRCSMSFDGGVAPHSASLSKDGNFEAPLVTVTQEPNGPPGVIEFEGVCSVATSGSIIVQVSDATSRTTSVNCSPTCVPKLSQTLPKIPEFDVGQSVGPLLVPIVGGNLDVTISVTTPFGSDSGLTLTPDDANRRYRVGGSCAKDGVHTATVSVTDTAAPCYQQTVDLEVSITCVLPELKLTCNDVENWTEGIPKSVSLVSFTGHWPAPPANDSPAELLQIAPDLPFMLHVESIDAIGTPNLSGSLNIGGTCHLPGTVSSELAALRNDGTPILDRSGNPVTISCATGCKAQKIACPVNWTFLEGAPSASFEVAFRGVELQKNSTSGGREISLELFAATDTTFQTPLTYLAFDTSLYSVIYSTAGPYPFRDPDFPFDPNGFDGGTIELTFDNIGDIPAGDYMLKIVTISEDPDNAPGVTTSDTSYCPLYVRPSAIVCPSFAYGPYWKADGSFGTPQVHILSSSPLLGASDTLSLVATFPPDAVSTPIGPLPRDDASSTATDDVFTIAGTCSMSVPSFVLVFEHKHKNALDQDVTELHYCKMGCTDGNVD